LLHNPVLLPEDIEIFAKIVETRGLREDEKGVDRTKIAGRIKLFHEVISRGLRTIEKESSTSPAS